MNNTIILPHFVPPLETGGPNCFFSYLLSPGLQPPAADGHSWGELECRPRGAGWCCPQSPCWPRLHFLRAASAGGLCHETLPHAGQSDLPRNLTQIVTQKHNINMCMFLLKTKIQFICFMLKKTAQNLSILHKTAVIYHIHFFLPVAFSF